MNPAVSGPKVLAKLLKLTVRPFALPITRLSAVELITRAFEIQNPELIAPRNRFTVEIYMAIYRSVLKKRVKPYAIMIGARMKLDPIETGFAPSFLTDHGTTIDPKISADAPAAENVSPIQLSLFSHPSPPFT